MNVLFEPGTQAHHDYLIGHRARVVAGELPMPVATRESVAEHEAAHAVVSLALGVGYDEVVVLPESEWRRGHAAGWSRAKVTGASREDVLIRGCAALWAGAIVDNHLFGSAEDITHIVRGSLLLPEAKQGLPFSLASDLVTRLRPAITAVAKRLTEAGRLTRADVMRIVCSTVNPN